MIFDLFHKHVHEHEYKEIGEKTECKHLTKHSKKDICPYPGCTQKFKVFMCKCGSTILREIDL